MRVLLVADTHIGIDEPERPRVRRRRRGADFLASFERALRPALRGEVDLVVHGGDLLYRSRVPAKVVERAIAPLRRVADAGVPVVLVPGNHERSRIPYPLLALHPRLHVFREPHTFHLSISGVRVAVSGFPFARRVGGGHFRGLVERTNGRHREADLRLLCIHQAVEGARVGVQDFTFRRGRDVVEGKEIPPGFAAVLSGHIHRAQTLTHDLGGNRLAAPVLYPGSVERTSFAEREETKGYVLMDLLPGPGGGRLERWSFVQLPARPMVVVRIDADRLDDDGLAARLRSRLRSCDPHSVVRIEVRGTPLPGAESALAASRVRSLAPASMNVTAAPRDGYRAAGRP